MQRKIPKSASLLCVGAHRMILRYANSVRNGDLRPKRKQRKTNMHTSVGGASESR